MPPNSNSALRAVLVPLDERPVNTRYPEMLAAIAGAKILLPPPEIRGRGRIPADLPALHEWLRRTALSHGEDAPTAAIVSADFLAYGNLINSRISDDSAALALSRLLILGEIDSRCSVHVFSLVTRVSNADDAVEEPLYWAEWGTTFYRYAALSHRVERGIEDDEDDLRTVAAGLPVAHKHDWLTRRLRNHTVNLGLLDMAARGTLSSLLLTSDDTSAYGFPSRERDWLGAWPALIGPALQGRTMMHPGADEVGSALTAKLINAAVARTPRVWIEYALSEDRDLIAPYEDRPVSQTVAGQLAACGCTAASSSEECDFILGVVTPSPRRADYQLRFAVEDAAARTQPYEEFLRRLEKKGFGQSVPIAIADVAYPNGSDPTFLTVLFGADAGLRPGDLCAYGAWNTAGNTLGTTIAQACCAMYIDGDPGRKAAQATFLAHRFLEDAGYQAGIRREARAEAMARWNRPDPIPEAADEQGSLCDFIERRLGDYLRFLQTHGIGVGLRIEAESVRLPWGRTFEVDFSLEWSAI